MEKNKEKIDERYEEIYKNNVGALNSQFVKDFFISKFGENSLKIIKTIVSPMTDEAIANKCKLKVSEVRTFLNRLHELGLASYTRIKDKNIQWYSYVWEINLKDIAAVIEKDMLKEIETLKQQIESATTVFSYYCPKCSRENIIEFDLAASLGFRCPSCDKQLKEVKIDQRENIDRLNELQERYNLFKNSIK